MIPTTLKQSVHSPGSRLGIIEYLWAGQGFHLVIINSFKSVAPACNRRFSLSLKLGATPPPHLCSHIFDHAATLGRTSLGWGLHAGSPRCMGAVIYLSYTFDPALRSVARSHKVYWLGSILVLRCRPWVHHRLVWRYAKLEPGVYVDGWSPGIQFQLPPQTRTPSRVLWNTALSLSVGVVEIHEQIQSLSCHWYVPLQHGIASATPQQVRFRSVIYSGVRLTAIPRQLRSH
jgi:hypothetical protein